MNPAMPDVDELAQADGVDGTGRPATAPPPVAAVEAPTPAAATQEPPDGTQTARNGDAVDGDARALAQAAWQADPSLTGAELGERFGMSERWGRQQIAAARNGNGATGSAAVAGRRQPQRWGRAGSSRAARQRQPVRSGNGNRQTGAAAVRRQPRRRSWWQVLSDAVARLGGPVPLPLLLITVAAVGLVTVVCAVVSYIHIRDLAVYAGMGSLAGWLPLGVDGLVVASSCSVIVDRHLNQRHDTTGTPNLDRHDGSGSPLAWAGVVVGLAGSLAANVLAVDPALVDLRVVRLVLAGYTPVALAVSGHLLLRMFSEQRRERR